MLYAEARIVCERLLSQVKPLQFGDAMKVGDQVEVQIKIRTTSAFEFVKPVLSDHFRLAFFIDRNDYFIFCAGGKAQKKIE